MVFAGYLSPSAFGNFVADVWLTIKKIANESNYTFFLYFLFFYLLVLTHFIPIQHDHQVNYTFHLTNGNKRLLRVSRSLIISIYCLAKVIFIQEINQKQYFVSLFFFIFLVKLVFFHKDCRQT